MDKYPAGLPEQLRLLVDAVYASISLYDDSAAVCRYYSYEHATRRETIHVFRFYEAIVEVDNAVDEDERYEIGGYSVQLSRVADLLDLSEPVEVIFYSDTPPVTDADSEFYGPAVGISGRSAGMAVVLMLFASPPTNELPSIRRLENGEQVDIHGLHDDLCDLAGAGEDFG